MNLARLTAALVAVTVITSCSDDPEPRTEPSETPTSSATECSNRPIAEALRRRTWIRSRNTLSRAGTRPDS